MAGVNKVILIGNLGAEPEVRTTPQGATVANLRLAVSETWKDQAGQRQEKTEWVNLVLWRQQADIAQRFLHKGSKIYVEGKLSTRSWDDKATGQKRYATDVVVDTFTMLDGRPGGEGGAGGFSGGEGSSFSAPAARPAAARRPAAAPADDFGSSYSAPSAGAEDDLPF
jgi:single-strand DNA-binding protein